MAEGDHPGEESGSPRKPSREFWVVVLRVAQGCMPLARLLWLIILMFHDQNNHDDPGAGHP
jgi:hypothetical protein